MKPVKATQSNIFTDLSNAVLLLWIIYGFFFYVVFVMPLSASVHLLTSWLSFVVSNCEFVTFPLVTWVRCGT